MKSKFFKDTQGLGESYCPPGRVCVCLRMDEAVYGQLLREAGQLGITSGDYIQRLMEWHGMGFTGQREPRAVPDLVHQSRADGWRE